MRFSPSVEVVGIALDALRRDRRRRDQRGEAARRTAVASVGEILYKGKKGKNDVRF